MSEVLNLKGFIKFVLSIFLLSCCGADAAVIPIDLNAGIPKVDLNALVQECPNFASYPGYNGVVWQKNLSYQLDMSGSMSVTSVWVILGRTGLSKKWLDWEIAIPKNGSAKVLQSAVFDPGSLSEVQKASPQDDGKMIKVNFAPSQEEFIIVLSFEQIYPRALAVQGLVWLSDSLPIWEQNVSVRVEDSKKLAYKSNIDLEPKHSFRDGFDFYEWMIVNQTPAAARSLRADSRPWLAFGNGRQGYEGLIPTDQASNGTAAQNKLSITFDLDLSEDGTLSGGVNMLFRNSWRDFLTDDPLETIREIFGSDKIFSDKIEGKDSRGNFEIRASLKPSKIILGTLGENAIVPLPQIQSVWLSELGKAMTPFPLRFQFTIDVTYRLNLPRKTMDVLLPQNVDIMTDKLKYSEKYVKRPKRVDLTMQFGISTTKVDIEYDRDLKAALYRLNNPKTIPIRVK